MGSYNSYPYPGLNPGQQLTIIQQLNPGEKSWISLLINAIHYFIDSVFIQQLKKGYQLVVLQKNKVLMIKHYPTYRGCKIAFNRLFKYKACKEEIKPFWSHFYYPDNDWLEEKQRRLNKG